MNPVDGLDGLDAAVPHLQVRQVGKGNLAHRLEDHWVANTT